MNLEEFLSSHRLSDYYPRIVQDVESPIDLKGYSHEELKKDFGIDKRAHRNRLLQAIATLPPGGEGASDPGSPFSSSIPVRLDALPAVIALPLKEYCEESHPTMRLWAACDAIEMLLRFLVISAIAEQRQGGKLDRKLVRELSGQIESPTLGAWYSMAVKLAKTAPEQSLMPEYAESVTGVLHELLNGPEKPGNPETSFLRLRNLLAHGGGMTRKEGARLLALWRQRFESALGAFAWLEELNLIARCDDGAIVCLDGLAAPQPFELAEALKLEEPGSLWLVRGSSHCLLWPLAVFGQAMTETLGDSRKSDTVHAQIYSRKEAVRLTYTPLGAAGFNYSESGPGEMEAFERLFSVDIGDRKGGFAIQDFDHELLRDAGQMVGRRKELVAMQEALTSKREGVWWLTGTAGMGKSFLVAKLFEELKDASADEDGTHVLAYRFRAGDEGRCNRDAFTTFVIERLQAKGILHERFKPKKDGKTAERLEHCLNEMKQDQQVTFLLDGLDEITRSDPDFAVEIPLALRLPRIRWVLAGRPEAGLVRAMRENAAIPLFPGGLPPMGEDDIRGMILDKIGPLRKKLLVNDQEQEDKVENPFISLVTRRAEGLPLYVKYVIGDVLGNKYRVLDGEEQLPPNLQAYHENLIQRLGIGSLQAILTPLACLLALSKEPLSKHQLLTLLILWKVLPDGPTSSALIQQALAALDSILKTAPSSDDKEGYTLYHASLRDHFLASQTVAPTIAAAREIFADCMDEIPECLTVYLFRFGIGHLLEADRVLDADREEIAKGFLLNLELLGTMVALGVSDIQISRWWAHLGGEDAAVQYEDALEALVPETIHESVRLGVSVLLPVCVLGRWRRLGERLHKSIMNKFETMLGSEHEFILSNNLMFSRLLTLGGNFGDAEQLIRHTLEIHERTQGPNGEDTLQAVCTLGLVMQEKQAFEEAEVLLRRFFEGKKLQLGPGHPETMVAATRLGNLLGDVGKLDEAEALLRRAVDSAGHSSDPESPANNLMVCCLGLLLEKKGEFEEAKALLRQALGLSERIYGKEHPDTLTILYNLASLLQNKGDLDQAETLLRRGLEPARRVLGAEHNVAFCIARDLGLLLLEQGDLVEAEPLVRQTLELSEQKLGVEHLETLTAISNLAILLNKKGDLDQAETLSRRGLEPARRMLGAEHDIALAIAGNLGSVLLQKGELVEAEPLTRQTLELSEKKFGAEHSNTFAAILNLGVVLRDKGDYEEAEPLLRQCFALADDTLGVDHPKALASGYNLAHLMVEKGDLDQAETLLRPRLEPARRVLGAEDNLAFWIARDLGFVLLEKGVLVEAEPLVRQSLELSEQKLGVEHLDTFTAIINLGMLLRNKGDFSDAEMTFRSGLERAENGIGAEHPQALDLLLKLGELLKAKGDYASAEPLLLQCLKSSENVFGEEHPATLNVLFELGDLLIKVRRYEESEQYLATAYDRSQAGWGEENLGTCLAMLKLFNCRFIMGAEGLPIDGLEAAYRAFEANLEIYHEWAKECRDLIAKIKKRAEEGPIEE